MKTTDIFKLRRSLEKNLDAKRFEHTLGVAYTAAALAMCHNGDVKRAQIAGLLHDCAKCMNDRKKIRICKNHNIAITRMEQKSPFLLHAKVGGYLAIHQYHITDEDIICAIQNHTTGRPAMSLLEKIIYVADYMEPGRKQTPYLDVIRREAFLDLDKALLMILEHVLAHLGSSGNDIDPMTGKTYEFYKREEERKRDE